MRQGFFACALLFVACGEPDEIDVKEGEQEDAFCDASCTRDLQCGRDGTLDACKGICKANVSGIENYRPEGVEIVAECILDLPCSKFYGNDSFIPCWERAEREIDPTASTRRFCRAWSTRWFECGASYSIETCESEWAINSASFLEKMSVCIESSCATIEACADNVRMAAAE